MRITVNKWYSCFRLAFRSDTIKTGGVRLRSLLRAPIKMVDWLAGAGPLFWLLPWAMGLLVAGTVAQRYIGLYDAQTLFFSSVILWLGPVPVPGGLTTFAALALNLLLKLLLRTRWSLANGGIITAHLAVLLLVLGGALSYLTHQEGYITLAEGESTASMQDYYARELVLWQKDKPQPLAIWPESVLAEQKRLPLPSELPFTLTVTRFCGHCEAYPVTEPEGKHGLAQKLLLEEAAEPAKEREENKAGIMLTLSNADKTADGLYLASELLPSQMPQFATGGAEYRLELTRERSPLPFRLTLREFRKITYPGSDEAKEYESHLTLTDENAGVERPLRIAMNEPLRYAGYALYQSSFLRMADGTEASVLAVVKNDAWLFPYLSGLLLAIGLGWHMALRWRLKKRAGEA
jgi:hypothetical protein